MKRTGRQDSESVVLGVDPGSQVTGWGIVAASGRSIVFRGWGGLRLGRGRPFPERLARLRVGLLDVLDAYAPTVACVEAPFHGVNARSALQLAHARGVVLATLAASSIEIAEVSPAEVKRVVTGNGRAEKRQVHAMLARVLRLPSDLPCDDASDALAVAFTLAFRAGAARGVVGPEHGANPASRKRTATASGSALRAVAEAAVRSRSGKRP